MSKYFILLITLLPLMSLSQSKEIFIDENQNLVSKKEYKKKCKLNVLKCIKEKAETVKTHRIYDKYIFGKLSNPQINEVKQYLNEISNIAILENKNIIIKYNDSLFGYEESEIRRRKNHRAYTIKFGAATKDISKKHNQIEYKPIEMKTYVKNHLKFINKEKKCVEKAQTVFNSQVLYIYNVDKGHNTMWPDLNWIQDVNKYLTTHFFRIPKYGGMLMIKPNGEYFVSNVVFNDKILTELLNGNWDLLKNDWNLTKNQLIKKGHGFFKIDNDFKRNSCF